MNNYAIRTNTRRTLGLLLAVAAATGGTVAHAGASTPVNDDLRKLVHLGVPGATVLIRDENGTTVTSAGRAMLKPSVRMREQRFRIGSVTKPMVATLVLQLVQGGRLSLEQPITDIVGKLAGGDDRVTVRDLLAHKSGIRDFLDDPRALEPYLTGHFDHVWRPQQLIGLATDHKPLFAPGTGLSYSNTNYVLLGLIIEEVTGTSLSEQMQTRIYGPLHMDDSSMPTRPRTSGPFVHGYLVDEQGARQDVTGVSPSVYWGAGNGISTTRDIADFLDGLLGGKLLTPATLAEMLTIEDEAPGYGCGLGITRTPPPCGSQVGHEGAVAGYATVAMRTNDGRTVVAMANALTTSDGVGTKQADKQWKRLVNRAACAG